MVVFTYNWRTVAEGRRNGSSRPASTVQYILCSLSRRQLQTKIKPTVHWLNGGENLRIPGYSCQNNSFDSHVHTQNPGLYTWLFSGLEIPFVFISGRLQKLWGVFQPNNAMMQTQILLLSCRILLSGSLREEMPGRRSSHEVSVECGCKMNQHIDASSHSSTF